MSQMTYRILAVAIWREGGWRWALTAADDADPPLCPFYRKDCPHDGQECGEGCVLEERSAEDSDEASDRGDFECHQERDQ